MSPSSYGQEVGLRDQQQALVLNALRGAAGKPVSFSELRDAGVEFPASIVSELELAGVAIERCRGGRGASVRLPPGAHGVTADPVISEPVGAEPAAPERVVPEPAAPERAVPEPAAPERVVPEPAAPEPEAVRSQPEPEPEAVRPQPEPEPAIPQPATARPLLPSDNHWSAVRRYRTSNRDALLLALVGSRRWLVPVAVGVAIAVAAVIVLTGISSGTTRQPRVHVAQRPHGKAPHATHRTHTATTHTATATTTASTATTTATTAPATQPTPVSLALATQLEAQGHSLLTSGQSAAAVPVLRRALAATGEHVGACLEPQSTMCLTYAYALYDLGRALRLSGNPSAAVPILERRLEIDNQRPTVLAELELARRGTT